MSTLQSRRRKSTKTVDKWHRPHNVSNFKCKDCGELGEDIAAEYCGNEGCVYRIKK